jgi:NADP-dependent 3-hydroxy acid dehydrogenase YdfG
VSQTARTIIVTGASRGIGRAVAEKLLQEGCHVIGIGRNFDASDKELQGFTPVPLDLARIAELPAQLKELRLQHPEIDGLVCNAGYGRFGSLEEFSVAQIQELVDTNLTSQILIAREFLPLFKTRGWGDLVFMGSEAALKGGGRGAVYSATKFALRGLTQSLREECAGTGVRVGIINPGMVRTGFFDELDFRPGDTYDSHLQPGDIADAVWLMLSARPGATIDEINLSPHKRTIQFRKAE